MTSAWSDELLQVGGRLRPASGKESRQQSPKVKTRGKKRPSSSLKTGNFGIRDETLGPDKLVSVVGGAG